MTDVLDTLKTTAVGFSGHLASRWDMLPDIVSIAVGGITIVYLVLKVWLTIKELKNAKKTRPEKRKKSNRNAR